MRMKLSFEFTDQPAVNFSVVLKNPQLSWAANTPPNHHLTKVPVSMDSLSDHPQVTSMIISSRHAWNLENLTLLVWSAWQHMYEVADLQTR